MIYERWGNMRYQYRGRNFCCRGYYVDTAGKNTKKIQEYIQNQLKEDNEAEQLSWWIFIRYICHYFLIGG